MPKHMGKRTIALESCPSFLSFAATAGKKEGEGPIRDSFDIINEDSFFGEESWEKAESAMSSLTIARALEKGGINGGSVDLIFAGDLQSQCTASTFAIRGYQIPFFGVYGACSTMAESLALAALSIEGGYARHAMAATSSHFCSAEREFRFPLEYGGQRTPTSQWTVTGAGAAVLCSEGKPPYVTAVTPGIIVDAGIKDANNMGAAMAPAAYETISTHLADMGRSPDYYDLILTGDLGKIGSEILRDFFDSDGMPLSNHNDCGLMIYNLSTQDVHAGGSGCGCSASVLCGHILPKMVRGEINRILFCATGALLSPTTTLQGESIPCICCAVAIENKKPGLR